MTFRCRTILLLAAVAAITPSAATPAGPASPGSPPPASRPAKFRVGTIRHEPIREGSGLVASRRHAGVFWTINDGGNPAALYAIRRDGTLLREYPVAATNTDWEDLAIDDAGSLYIADVGNNDGRRKEIQLLRIDEPDPRAPIHGAPAPLRVRATWRLEYPAAPFDCESLFVFDGKAYLVPKRLNGSPAEIFRAALAPAPRAVKLERVAELPAVRAPVTSADVSSDGERVALLTVFGPYVVEINRDVAAAGGAKAVYSRYVHPNMEAACFVEGGLLVTTETRDVFFFRDEHFKPTP